MKQFIPILFLTYSIASLIGSSVHSLAAEVLPVQEVPNAPALPTHVVFNLPALRKLTITQIQTHLGKPIDTDSESEDRFVGDPEGDKTYQKEGLELRIHYQRKTGKVIRFYLTPSAGAIPENKLNTLLVTGHLELNTKGFRIKPIFVHQDPPTHRYTNLMVEVK
jgi:hypothetical protein